jgi:hypothetical protein
MPPNRKQAKAQATDISAPTDEILTRVENQAQGRGPDATASSL